MVKLPKPITHERRLDDINSELRSFLQVMEPLELCAQLWVQLPGSPSPADVGALPDFLGSAVVNARYAAGCPAASMTKMRAPVLILNPGPGAPRPDRFPPLLDLEQRDVPVRS
ncbi:uncharacterized protein YecE (DUF72 family) [Allocatelliglobosispora scoriae]|uniref:Uncharacterized protein YecE (DUF72 family) n=1 Tax=Allocatelliglobosispora scoriae TaxID=643052 RepID=A0A841BN53_9ACTN|nr:uncharacterized protein YecE (DUF72 family) [Allocatelliglobosispora scoriae]